MDECLVITRGGWGDVWLAKSPDDAYVHPIWQPCDAVIRAPHEILSQYNVLELPRLFRRAGGEDFERTARAVLDDESLRQTQKIARLEQYAQGVWDRLMAEARPLPEDPSVIVEQVREDRAYMIREGKEPIVADQKTETKGGAAATKTEKKEAAPRKKAFPLDGVIHFGVKDKENGINYDAKDNNPKRVNSESHARFSKYRDGMTVQQFVDAVGNEAKAMADLKWDVSHGYVVVKASAAPAAAK